MKAKIHTTSVIYNFFIFHTERSRSDTRRFLLYTNMYIYTPVYSGKSVRFFKIVVRFCNEKRQKLTKNGQKRCHFLRNEAKTG